jgi:hypothetical protein
MSDQFSHPRAPKNYGSVHDLSAMMAGGFQQANSSGERLPIFVR